MVGVSLKKIVFQASRVL